MRDYKIKTELKSILKAILKKEYPRYLSKDFSSQIMDKINKKPIRVNFFSHTLRVASAVLFAFATLFVMESFIMEKVKYSKTTINHEIITPTRNVTDQVDDCDKVNANIKSSERLVCK